LIEVPAGGEKAFLAPLPIDKLPGIGEKTQNVLNGLGIRTLGELAAMPLDALKSRFGIYAETIHAHANGIGSDQVEPPTEAKSTSRSTTFPQDTRDIQFIKATLRYLTERVGNDLREKGKLAKCVHITVRYADFTTVTRQRTVSPPTDADQLIFDTALDLLKRELTAGKKQAVRLIGIGASSLVAGRQLNLLDPTPRRLEKLNAAIDRIREKYGFTSIQTGRTLLLRDIFPESERGYTLHTPGLSR
ncbi:MAG: DNA polymerase IV, partial [Chloroflexota bacterium]